ncbi:Neurogenic locus notch -like protein 1 [Collichthys lucidus]|uniref:Neurogenic locus notch-like protein 1 n=1 Tax=Collichthys lucidus TaxID=240159 RepID=A0A4U5UUZ8_COLLU|nr:Neurogenic locus notch -like protein 1 [Collichthys lucidus]
MVSDRRSTGTSALRSIFNTVYFLSEEIIREHRKRPQRKPPDGLQNRSFSPSCGVRGRTLVAKFDGVDSPLAGLQRVTWRLKMCDCSQSPNLFRRGGIQSGSFSSSRTETGLFSKRPAVIQCISFTEMPCVTVKGVAVPRIPKYGLSQSVNACANVVWCELDKHVYAKSYQPLDEIINCQFIFLLSIMHNAKNANVLPEEDSLTQNTVVRTRVSGPPTTPFHSAGAPLTRCVWLSTHCAYVARAPQYWEAAARHKNDKYMQPLEIQHKLAPAAAITLVIHVKPLDVKLTSFSDDCQQSQETTSEWPEGRKGAVSDHIITQRETHSARLLYGRCRRCWVPFGKSPAAPHRNRTTLSASQVSIKESLNIFCLTPPTLYVCALIEAVKLRARKSCFVLSVYLTGRCQVKEQTVTLLCPACATVDLLLAPQPECVWIVRPRATRCPDGYVGSRCQFRDPCLSSPCMNGGMCRAVPKGNTVDYSCTCRLGYSDRRCLTPINNVCISSMCHNGGTCELESLQTYRCRCPPGWSGKLCQQPDPCASNPCANGGQCSAFESNFICRCTPFFSGKTCKQDVNECDVNPSPCKNGGMCINDVGGYRCKCPTEYTGKHCESRYLPCNPSPCHNGGTCIQRGETSYECSCVPGFTGKNCNHNIDDCPGHECHNGGTCVDGVNTYNCQCKPEFTGQLCTEDVDECQLMPNACQNGGTCHNTFGSYQCVCVNGWTGDDCSENIDDCASAACNHGSTCHDRVASFFCECPHGRTATLVRKGSNCDTNPVSGNHFCTCPSGYVGASCDKDVDECALAQNFWEPFICQESFSTIIRNCFIQATKRAHSFLLLWVLWLRGGVLRDRYGRVRQQPLPEQRQVYRQDQHLPLRVPHSIPYFETSAVTGVDVDQAVTTLLGSCNEEDGAEHLRGPRL